MDAFLATLSLIFSHSATALLLQTISKSASREWTPAFTIVFKQPLNLSEIGEQGREVEHKGSSSAMGLGECDADTEIRHFNSCADGKSRKKAS